MTGSPWCQSCGDLLVAGARFCRSCGREVEGSGPQPTTDGASPRARPLLDPSPPRRRRWLLGAVLAAVAVGGAGWVLLRDDTSSGQTTDLPALDDPARAELAAYLEADGAIVAPFLEAVDGVLGSDPTCPAIEILAGSFDPEALLKVVEDAPADVIALSVLTTASGIGGALDSCQRVGNPGAEVTSLDELVGLAQARLSEAG